LIEVIANVVSVLEAVGGGHIPIIIRVDIIFGADGFGKIDGHNASI